MGAASVVSDRAGRTYLTVRHPGSGLASKPVRPGVDSGRDLHHRLVPPTRTRPPGSLAGAAARRPTLRDLDLSLAAGTHRFRAASVPGLVDVGEGLAVTGFALSSVWAIKHRPRWIIAGLAIVAVTNWLADPGPGELR
jgi:hypothetical protein